MIRQGTRDTNLLSSPADAFGKPVCRLGLASRGGCALTADDVLFALERGVNFLNWPGAADSPGGPDGLSAAVAALGGQRESVVVCVQFGARTAREAAEELRAVLETLRTDYVDVLTFYYVECAEEWQQLIATDGALTWYRNARRDGIVRRLGVTSHQRPLAARMAQSGLLDALMIRYNAAHRGAEQEVFQTTDELHVPVIAYTALRWGALLETTPDDPPEFVVPPASEWYRFVLYSPSVAVVLAAPHDRAELEEDLKVLAAGPLTEAEYALLAEHGERVRRHAGRFW
jgi:predicted aldo/keto reductase-like oxidoreductase